MVLIEGGNIGKKMRSVRSVIDYQLVLLKALGNNSIEISSFCQIYCWLMEILWAVGFSSSEGNLMLTLSITSHK